MKNYELTYLITPDLSEQDLKTFTEKVNSFVLEENGVLGDSLKPVRKQLGYPIKKQNEAFLATIYFSLNPENLVNLEIKLKSENQILRYIILSKKSVEERPELKKKEPQIKEKPPVEKLTKVELKDIDKKIEEILKE